MSLLIKLKYYKGIDEILLDNSHYVNQSNFNDYKEAIQKKINNFDRRIQAIISLLKNDQYQKEIAELKNSLNIRKPTSQEFYDLNVQVQ